MPPATGDINPPMGPSRIRSRLNGLSTSVSQARRQSPKSTKPLVTDNYLVRDGPLAWFERDAADWLASPPSAP